MRSSLKIYAPIAGAVLVSRLVLEHFPVQGASTAQEIVLQWPIVLVAILLGFPAMHVAHKLGVPGEVTSAQSAKKSILAFGVGFGSAFLLIALDLIFVFPEDMNVLGFESIPYYLVGAFLVETIQHLIPFALWLGLVIYFAFREKGQEYLFWIGALLISLIEPLSQLGGDLLQGYSLIFYLASAAVFFAINLAQMYIFRRGGFEPMLLYRVGLYSLWHWIWGPLRIGLLF